jgi:predicted aspartyl protease
MKNLLLFSAVCFFSGCGMSFAPVAPLNPMADVAVSLRFRAQAPHVQGSINGRISIPLLLDTGASVSVFEPDVAAFCGLLPAGGRHRVEIRGVHGNAAASFATMSTLQIGSWRSAGVPCLVCGTSSFRPGGLGNAILGMDHLRRQCSFETIDFRRGVVELGFSRAYQPPAGAWVTRTPVRWVNGQPFIRVSAGGMSWDAVVDTGSSWGIVIDQSMAARLGQARSGIGMGDHLILSGVGGSMRASQAGARIIRGPDVELCGETHPGAQLYVMPGPKRIGCRFWDGTRMTLDFRTNSLWLER